MRKERSHPALWMAMLLASLWVLCAQAQERNSRADRPQVSAATAEALARMRSQVEETSLSGNLTVGEFVRRLGAEQSLEDQLMGAELVGGPRWIDNDTCQVQLQMSGVRVARILQKIAVAYPDQKLVSQNELTRLQTDWERRTFSGTGSCTSYTGVESIRPRATGSAWDGVSSADRKRALLSAKDDAVKHVIDSVQPILVADGKTVSDIMSAHPRVRQAVEDWLNIRPVLQVEYRRDLQVQLTMAGTPNGLFDVFRKAVAEEPDVKTPRREYEWAAVRSDFERQMAQPIGHATVAPTTAPAAVEEPVTVELPRHPPSWVSDHIEVQASADVAESDLRAARLAEATARRKIVERVNDLPLGRRVTLGQAAKQDARVRDAIAQAMDRAQITNTDYSQKKKVTITLRLDLQDLWDALRSAQ